MKGSSILVYQDYRDRFTGCHKTESVIVEFSVESKIIAIKDVASDKSKRGMSHKGMAPCQVYFLQIAPSGRIS